ncbi:MAG: hypothetical protein LIP01_00230, partial [Tannerellaceae bacterium]|nr:hypothetical protein [Tannerellaceae bacterium]
SIPNRFTDSFMVGTAVVTDELKVRWYLPFSKEEVVQTIPMGYKKCSEVDWKSFNIDVKKLEPINSKRICELYDEKWKPEIVAEYMLNCIRKS